MAWTRVALGSKDASGRLLKPPTAGDPYRRHPIVILLPAIAGVNDYIGRVALDLAQRGHCVMAIDYFARQDGVPDLSSPAAIMAAVASVSDGQVVADVSAALDYAGTDAELDETSAAVLGFCIGGTLALLSSAELNAFRCSIAFYGLLRYRELTENKPVSPLDAVERIRNPVLGHWGDADHLVPTADVTELRERLKGKPAEIYLYPGAGHAFHEDFRDVYRPVAAREAWMRSVRYLSWYLRAEGSA